jgi:hypothetical protein
VGDPFHRIGVFEFWPGGHSHNHDDLWCVFKFETDLVIDSYLSVAPEALLLINGLKTIFSFGFSFGVVPWVEGAGFQRAFGTMVGIQSGIMLLGIPLWYWGKQLRHQSASWKVVVG